MDQGDSDLSEEYRNRNERLRYVIDVLASEDNLDDHGRKAEIAREHGLKQHRIQYVLREYEDIVDWRRSANSPPLETEAVKMAIDDEEEPTSKVVADGLGGITVGFEYQLDEAFRAVRLLPSDLGGKLFAQLMADDQISQEELQRILAKDN